MTKEQTTQLLKKLFRANIIENVREDAGEEEFKVVYSVYQITVLRVRGSLDLFTILIRFREFYCNRSQFNLEINELLSCNINISIFYLVMKMPLCIFDILKQENKNIYFYSEFERKSKTRRRVP